MSKADRVQKMRELETLIQAGLSCREVAARLDVSVATAIRWTRRAGLVSRRSRRLSEETRAAIEGAASEGLSAIEAAARFGVSAETARRIARRPKPDRDGLRRQVLEAVAGGLSRRKAALRIGVSVSTAIRWAREETGPRAESAATARRVAPPRPDVAREAQRAQLIAAVASGLSCRGAAALVGLPVATAIRWVGQAKSKG